MVHNLLLIVFTFIVIIATIIIWDGEDRDYIAHWIIGIICTLIWFWGSLVGIPQAAVTLAASIVPGLLGHALGYSGGRQTAGQFQQSNEDLSK